MSHGSNGSGPKKKFIELLFPSTPLLGAMTVAHKSRTEPEMRLARGIVAKREDAASFCNLLLETTIMSTLASECERFKQFHADRPVVICSAERAESEYARRSDIKTLITKIPLRCDEYPTEFVAAKFVEPMAETDEKVLFHNPHWERAKFEIEFHCDPGKIFYDSIPIELFKGKNSYLFYVSGQITMVEDSVDAVVFTRNVVDKREPVAT
jgi:hypothetical protein